MVKIFKMKQLCKVVMLPTNEASNIIIAKSVLHLSKAAAPTNKEIDHVCQHLYLTSNEEIKEGDWCFELHNRESSATSPKYKDLEGNTWWLRQSNCNISANSNTGKKIIATTDKSLHSIKWKDTPLESPSKLLKGIAVIPESFIKTYVEANGKISEVLVEYDEKKVITDGWISTISERIVTYVPILKLREDNTVILSQTKTYTRDELKAYLKIALAHPMRTEEEINERIHEIIG
jgi:hypothetical protein